MAGRTFTFTIDTEIAPSLIGDLLRYIIHYHLFPRPTSFVDVSLSYVDDVPALSFTILGLEKAWFIRVNILGTTPLKVEMTPSPGTPREAVEQVKDAIIVWVQSFEEVVRKTTLYFAWVEGEEIHPERGPQARQEAVGKLFSESMLLLFILFMFISFPIFWMFGGYAPIILIALQLVMVLFSDKIVARMGQWRITQENPHIHILQYHLPYNEYLLITRRYGPEVLLKIKEEIYERTLRVGKDVDRWTAREVLLKYGIGCAPENMVARKVDVYGLVKEVADRFGLPVPKIAVANIMVPNAAASGPSPSHGTVLITTGLLVQLEEDEILSVLAHEFSHLKGRDPLAMFAITAIEYLLRVYVLWPIAFLMPFFYYPLALGAVYFVAKFFEAKADLEAAMAVGEPRVLAEALRKIGFRRLQYERIPTYRLHAWLTWDPHPPLYFRIKRLEELETPIRVKHPLLRSAADCLKGFILAIT